MLYTTIHNLFKQHFISWNGLLLNATNKLQIPTKGQGPGGVGSPTKIYGWWHPNLLFLDQDQAKICLSNLLLKARQNQVCMDICK